MAEPKNDDIELLASITALHPSEVIKLLKAHKNDVEAATNAFLDNPHSYPFPSVEVPWDEDAFHSDKTDRNQPAFTIDPQDTLKPTVFDSAPSRPPSRVSTRAGQLTGQAGVSISDPQEARDLDQALKMSMMSTDSRPQNQMSGVTNVSAAYFGPATQEDYDRNWALTVPRDYTKEIWLNPEPVDRKRDSTKPAFLRPSTQGHRLPALIKILQTIPLAREAMLCRHAVLSDYGHNSEWWDGATIQVPKIFHVANDGQDHDIDEVPYEVQRLVAFLEETERAYGSVDSLLNVLGTGLINDDEILPLFFKAWDAASQYEVDGPTLQNVVESVGTKMNPDEPEFAENHSFTTLQVRIDEEIADKGHTLYDAVDDILWTIDGLQMEQQDVYLEKVGDVLILDVKRANEASSGLGIKIPAVWYLDRYLKSSVAQVKEMRENKAAIQEELDLIEQRRVKIAEFKPPGPLAEAIDGLSLLKTASRYFDRSAARVTMSDQRESASAAKDGIVFKELQMLMGKIAQRLQSLEDSKNKARGKLEEVSKLYTKRDADSEHIPHHPYTLRGVCSNPKTIYVLEKTRPEVENDMLSAEAKDWQWWKITYVGSDSKPVSESKVREIEVLKAARDESNSALLVYANEKAVTYGVGELPSELRNFVRLDNLSFTAELEKSGASKPMTPKRKADEADSDDVGPEYNGSPAPKRNGEISPTQVPSESSLPPSYLSHPPSPPYFGSSHGQVSIEGMKNPNSYDETIPISLRPTPSTIDPSILLNQGGGHPVGQEMKDRGGMMGIVQAGSENRSHGYTLGSYVPEISMDDTDADGEDVPTTSKHIGFA